MSWTVAWIKPPTVLLLNPRLWKIIGQYAAVCSILYAYCMLLEPARYGVVIRATPSIVQISPVEAPHTLQIHISSDTTSRIFFALNISMSSLSCKQWKPCAQLPQNIIKPDSWLIKRHSILLPVADDATRHELNHSNDDVKMWVIFYVFGYFWPGVVGHKYEKCQWLAFDQVKCLC